MSLTQKNMYPSALLCPETKESVFFYSHVQVHVYTGIYIYILLQYFQAELCPFFVLAKTHPD